MSHLSSPLSYFWLAYPVCNPDNYCCLGNSRASKPRYACIYWKCLSNCPFTVCGCEWLGEHRRSGLWTQHTTSLVPAAPLCSAPCTVSSLQQDGMSWSQCGLKRDLFFRTFMEMTISSVALREWVCAAFHSFPFCHLSCLWWLVIYQFAYRLLKLFYCCGPSGTQNACL